MWSELGISQKTGVKTLKNSLGREVLLGTQLRLTLGGQRGRQNQGSVRGSTNPQKDRPGCISDRVLVAFLRQVTQQPLALQSRASVKPKS